LILPLTLRYVILISCLPTLIAAALFSLLPSFATPFFRRRRLRSLPLLPPLLLLQA